MVVVYNIYDLSLLTWIVSQFYIHSEAGYYPGEIMTTIQRDNVNLCNIAS